MTGLLLLPALLLAQPDATALRHWLVWGPYAGMAGLSVLAPDLETRVRPARGDVMPAQGVAYRTAGVWRGYVSEPARTDLDTAATFAQRPETMGWSRGCAYAHAYLHVDRAQPAELELEAVWRIAAWLNGQPVSGPAALQAGWNRLLVKVYFPPQHLELAGWWFECRLSTRAGQPVPGLEVALDDPDRDPAALSADHPATEVSLVRPDRWAPLFNVGEEVRLRLRVRLADKAAAATHRTLRCQLHGPDGLVAGELARSIGYSGAEPAEVELATGSLPVGHYQLAGDLSSEAGVTDYLPPLSFVVLRGPVDPAQDDAPRKLAGCDYWLMNSPDPLERVRWLHQVGLLRNVGSCASWWTTWQDGKLGTDYKPYVDETLAEAGKLGVDLVGYLEAGWPVKVLQQQPREHWLQQGLSPDRLVVWPWMPLPPDDTPEFEQAVRGYVVQTVNRYKDRIHTWKSYNEIDIAGGMSPQRYARLARILFEAVKAADPQARMSGASLVYPGRDWIRELFDQTDFAKWHDAYDIHAHPVDPPRIGGSLGNGKNEGLAGLLPYVQAGAPEKPIWYGEVSPPLSHAEGGQWAQASNVVKEAAFAIADPRIEVLAWLVPYGGGVPDIATSGPAHLPFPAVVAINLCGHLLDGRRVLPPLALPEGVQQLRVTAPQGETMVLWSDRPTTVRLPAGGGKVELIDPLGRFRTAEVRGGAVELELNTTPVFVVGRSFGAG